MSRLTSLTFLFILMIFSTELNAKDRIAVMQFETDKNITASEAVYITERVRIALIKTEKFDVVSNDQFGHIDSCTAETCLVKVGQALGCSHMIMGKIENAFGQYTLSGKILDVAAQKYVKAEEIIIKDKKAILEASQRLVESLTDTLPGKIPYAVTVDPKRTSQYERHVRRKSYGAMIGLTLLAPGAGHLYAEQMRGAFYMGLWLVSATGTILGQVFYTQYYESYKSASSDFDRLYAASQDWKKIRGYSSYIFLATYAFALLDILITGSNYEKIYTFARHSVDTGLVRVMFTNPHVIRAASSLGELSPDATGIAMVRHF